MNQQLPNSIQMFLLIRETKYDLRGTKKQSASTKSKTALYDNNKGS